MVFCNVNQSSVDSDDHLVKIDPLLKSVARTFYLSLTYLPKAIREPMSLAYLLARLSDTVVDEQLVPVSLRSDLLSSLKRCVQHPNNPEYLTHLYQKISLCLPYFSNQDLTLLESCGFLLSRLQHQSAPIQTLIQEVLVLIFEGQAIDLNYFDSSPEINYFTTEHELERYLYLVAGSVGEFWTKLCCLCIPNFTRENVEQLLSKAVAFGKALQLTNILRDVHHDLTQGRCYLPIQTDLFSGDCLTKESLGKLLGQHPSIIQDWRAKALLYLEDAKAYTNAIKHRRIRFSVMVPMHLARKTLFALPVKLSKTEVYLTLAQAWLQTYGFPLRTVTT
ncbi:MAG: squalene/phytoene synthase family protein [Gammaproteobacteria bacterium]